MRQNRQDRAAPSGCCKPAASGAGSWACCGCRGGASRGGDARGGAEERLRVRASAAAAVAPRAAACAGVPAAFAGVLAEGTFGGAKPAAPPGGTMPAAPPPAPGPPASALVPIGDKEAEGGRGVADARSWSRVVGRYCILRRVGRGRDVLAPNGQGTPALYVYHAASNLAVRTFQDL